MIPATSFLRWERIAEIRHRLDVLWSVKRTKKDKPLHETPEYEALTTELRALMDREREDAIDSGWPVWQQGQRFHYLAQDGTLREGDVIRFNLDALTVTAMTWPDGDYLGSLHADGRYTVETMHIVDIEAGEAQRREREQSQQAVNDAARRAAMQPEQIGLFDRRRRA